MPAQVVDSFNVDGKEYHIEPVLDPIPMEGSTHAVQSGGVYQQLVETKGDTPANTGMDALGSFTRKGAYDYFNGNDSGQKWLSSIFGERLVTTFRSGTIVNSAVSMFKLDYGNGKWAAAMTAGSGIHYSDDDGKSWHKCSGVDVAGGCDFIAYVKDLWIASRGYLAGEASTNQQLVVSSDLITWEYGKPYGYDPSVSSQKISTFTFVTYFKGKYIGFGNGWDINYGNNTYGVWWSDDGKVWHCAYGGSYKIYNVRSAIEVNGKLIVAGSRAVSNTPYPIIVSTEDGINWTEECVFDSTMYSTGAGTQLNVRSFSYAKGVYVMGLAHAVGSGTLSGTYGGIWWSEDLIHWTQAADTNGIGYTAIQYIEDWDLWVCAGKLASDASNKGIYSNDGKVWKTANTNGVTPSSGTFYMHYANGILMNGLSSNVLHFTRNGVLWESFTVPDAVVGSGDIMFRNGRWVGYGVYSASIDEVIPKGMMESVTYYNIPST